MNPVFCYLLIINASGLLCMLADKLKAKKAKYRIPEKILLGIAFLGGSLGCTAGMYLFRHKTRKPAFRMVLPALSLLHIIIFWFLIRERILTF